MVKLNNTYQLLSESQDYTFLSAYNGKVRIRLYARIHEQSTAENKSIVYVKLTRYVTGDYSNVQYSCYAKEAKLGGDLSLSYSNGDYASFSAGNEYTIFEKDFTVYHADDGSKSLRLNAYYDDSYISPLSIGDVYCELPTIARKSEIGTVAFTDGAIERGFSVSFVSAASSFVHCLELAASDEVIATRDGYTSGSDVALTADELLALYRKNTKDVTVRLITKNNGTDIGSAEKTETLAEIGNTYIKADGAWKRGVVHVGNNPGVMMIRHGGEWTVAR